MKKKEKHKKIAKKLAKEKAPMFDISQETKNSIFGVISIIFAVLSTLSFFGRAGAAGEIFNSLSKSLFGWGFFIVPFAFVFLAMAFIRSISRKIYLSAFIGTMLFILSILAAFFIFGEVNFTERVHQGGYLGIVLGLPLLKSVGPIASWVILVAMLAVSTMVALNLPFYKLIKKEDEEKPLVDNIVVKRGGEVVDANKETKPVQPKSQSVARVAKVDMTDREFVIKHLKHGKWTLPPLELLNRDQDEAVTGDINASANIIKRTLSNFGIEVEMGEVSVGPTVTQFTMRPAIGVKLSKITTLNSDLSLALAAHPIRIEAPIPGKSLVGIEVPNKKVSIVGLRDMFESEEYKKPKFFFPLSIGRDVSGNPVFAGLDKMPHLLVAGATGTGKSVSINTLLLSMLYKHSPDMLKLILVDPKRVELNLYNGIPHLITPVITDNKKVLGALKWAVTEMDRRYDTLSKSASKDIFSYNAKLAEKKSEELPMSFIVIVIDELADLMASYGRDVEAAIVRLAQMSRAVGIHLILSTQRPSVEVITGLIKANITSRIAFQVASQVDSRTILDMSGAEKLLGKGDMLFMAGDVAKPRRLQGANVTEKEVKDVVKFLRTQAEELDMSSEVEMQVDFNATGSFGGNTSNPEDSADDALYADAKEVVVHAGKASASLLQRRLKVGYARAARLLDILEENGIIGAGDGAKAREVYIRPDGTVAQEPAMLARTDLSAGRQELGGINADTPEAENEEV
ncbi:MAG: DNA translocase FtsK 4TM domain-containing protein [bacterium]|nr:DNA translocase FtsK 4TM domain-containing protein [bacterium]